MPGTTVSANITILGGAALSGHVLYSDGSPAIAAYIVVLDADTTPPKRISTQAHFWNNADDQGHFRIPGLPPGQYLVGATAYQCIFASYRFALPKTAVVYSPQTFHQSAATIFNLHAREDRQDIVITLPLALLHNVSGTLTGLDGEPINTATVTLTDTSDPTLTLTGDVNSDGQFHFNNVPPATYSLHSTNARFTIAAWERTGRGCQRRSSQTPPRLRRRIHIRHRHRQRHPGHQSENPGNRHPPFHASNASNLAHLASSTTSGTSRTLFSSHFPNHE